MAQVSVANYPLDHLTHLLGLNAAGNVRTSTTLREFNVLNHGAFGNGSSDDYGGVVNAVAALYANKGGKLVFPFTPNGYRLSSTVLITPTSYANGGSIEIDLCGNHITQTHNGWMFDIRENYFSLNNGNHEAGFKRIDFRGNGAYLIGTATALGPLRLCDNVRSRAGGYTAKGYTVGTGMRLHNTEIAYDGIASNDYWCEMNTFYDIHTIGTKVGIHLMAGGGLDGLNALSDRYGLASFLGCKFTNIVHQGDVDNAIGFDIEGSGNECIWESCGGFVNQNGTTGGKLFHFNGTQPGIFIGPWSDVAGNSSPLHDVVFGSSANTGNVWARPTFVQCNNLALPHDWRDKINVIGPVKLGIYSGGVMKGLNEMGKPAREVLPSARTFYVNAATGSDSYAGVMTSNVAAMGYGPFLTVAKALDTIRDNIDCGGFDLTIQLADSTYGAPIVVDFTPVGLGGATFTITGNTSVGGAVIVSVSSADAFLADENARVKVQGIEFRTGTSGSGIKADNDATVIIGTGCQFGACATNHIETTRGGKVSIEAGYNISGNAPDHWTCKIDSRLTHLTGNISANSRTFSGTFARCSERSVVVANGTFTTSGSSGMRYYIASGGIIQTYGAGASYLPGATAGTAVAAEFSQYL